MTTEFKVEGPLPPHEYVSSRHCRDCMVLNIHRNRELTGGWEGVRQRARAREAMRQTIANNPDRYRWARGVVADIETGLVYGKRMVPIGHSDTSGYLQIDDQCTDDGHAVGAHIVVWESVHGPIPETLEINHINGCKTDNRLVNLELVTRSGNILHAYRLGLKSNQGEKHPSHKLTEVQVKEIRSLHDAGASKKDLAERFAVSRRQINDIVLYNVWKHI